MFTKGTSETKFNVASFKFFKSMTNVYLILLNVMLFDFRRVYPVKLQKQDFGVGKNHLFSSACSVNFFFEPFICKITLALKWQMLRNTFNSVIRKTHCVKLIFTEDHMGIIVALKGLTLINCFVFNCD